MNVIRCKIALIGDPRVGKTSIVNQLVKNSFNGSYQTTLGIEYNQYEVKINDTYYISLLFLIFPLIKFYYFSF